jgi:phosphatidate cytidylyltransferase
LVVDSAVSAVSERRGALSGRLTMLGRRLLVAALGGPAVLLIVVLGGAPFLALVVLASGYGGFELYAALRKAGYAPFGELLVPLSAALPLLAGIASPTVEQAAIAVGVTLTFGVAVARGKARGPADWAFTLAGALLVGGLLRFLVLLRELPAGLWWVLAVVLGTWACDTAAYAFGRLFGRTPLAPWVSPKKTVEGLLGSLAATPLALLGFVALSPALGLGSPIGLPAAAGLGLLVAATATLGDLSESLIKRQCGVKDSGALLPGHGGLLDRIDGLMFSGLAGYGVALVAR